VAESFFGSLKQQQVQWRHYQTRFEAQQDVMNYIPSFTTVIACIHIWVTKAPANMNRNGGTEESCLTGL